MCGKRSRPDDGRISVEATLSRHVRECASCADVVDVTSALLADAVSARAESAPPSSAIVWWRAQMRARQEAARAAERPLTVVHALAIACAAGPARRADRVGRRVDSRSGIRGAGSPPPPPRWAR